MVSVTSSLGAFHNLCAMVLIGLVHSYFGLKLHASNSLWRFAHWPVPVALLLATGFHSYGLWQKSFIVYLVVLVSIHYHLVCRDSPARLCSASRRRADRRRKRRAVYVLSAGRSWKRLPRSAEPSSAG